MRVLFVFSGTSDAGISPFVEEQAVSLRKAGIEVDMFPIKQKGVKGYLRAVKKLRSYLKKNQYDIVHGHFLWSIIVAGISGHKKVVGTFHGSDANDKKLQYFSKLVSKYLINTSIFVNPKMAEIVGAKRTAIIPCGIELDLFMRTEWDISFFESEIIKPDYKNILFASRFDRYEKNYPLAKKAVDHLRGEYKVNLIELKGFSRDEVAYLLHNVDVLLLTSLWEGSPQVVKEAMACNLPIVTTNVGDVSWLLDGVTGSHIVQYDFLDVSDKLKKSLDFKGKTNGRDRIIELGLDNKTVVNNIIKVYKSLI